MSTATISDTTNSKLGSLIHSWSIPPGREWSCPGESTLCSVRCYAKRGFFRMPNVKDSHVKNFVFSETAEFENWMLSVIAVNYVRVMRIHASGDFYDIPYIQKWVRIVKQSPRQLFFAYTRSWRKPELLPELIKLAGLENFQLWWSLDRETGPAPLIRGVRRAYMAISDADARCAPDDCDLVFRDKPQTPMKKANGVQVCPPENGVQTRVQKVTCSRCKICWNKKNTKWETELSPYLYGNDQEINAPSLK